MNWVMKKGRPRKDEALEYPARWMEAVEAYESGLQVRKVVLILDGMSREVFHRRYKRFCEQTNRPKARRKRSYELHAPKPKRKEPRIHTAPPPKYLPPLEVRPKPTVKDYLSDDGMRAFLREGSGLAREIKSCARGEFLLMEGEALRKKLRLNCRDFRRLMDIAREEMKKN